LFRISKASTGNEEGRAEIASETDLIGLDDGRRSERRHRDVVRGASEGVE